MNRRDFIRLACGAGLGCVGLGCSSMAGS
ncbi:MAG: twin-arginine translocation signal domain-containing protein, partial [Phycisphaerae bacterium]|nr:twin-arginine translocation signal domain-containing protein [Phycisphaerae bacterium]